MALSAFDDKSHPPEPAELSKVLGSSARAWTQLVSGVAGNHPPITEAWNFSGAKYGWSLRLKQKDRIVLYLIPQAGEFLVGVVLGAKAVQAAKASNIPTAMLALIDAAPVYAEGRGIRFPVRTRADVAACLTLAELKMAR